MKIKKKVTCKIITDIVLKIKQFVFFNAAMHLTDVDGIVISRDPLFRLLLQEQSNVGLNGFSALSTPILYGKVLANLMVIRICESDKII